jgi:outer membrane protein OmpA-like peptidoglycan-associated protein
MRGAARRFAREEEEESAFVSMTDMTVSFLFIVMLVLAFFASQLRDPNQVPKAEYDAVVAELADVKSQNVALNARIVALEAELAKAKDRPLETYLAHVAEQRKKLLEALQHQLQIDFPDLQVVLSDEADALRFAGDGLFKSDQPKIRDDKVDVVRKLAARLNALLPCFTLGKSSKWSAQCNEEGAVVEAVLIEGHTDSSGEDKSNLTLSTNRADETFFSMTKFEPSLLDFLNSRKQPVVSVAGYGPWRPISDNATAKGRAANRRIDLRLIMYAPNTLEDIERIRERLKSGLSEVKTP